MNERELDIIMLEAEEWVQQLFTEFYASWLGMRADEGVEDIEGLEVQDGYNQIPGAPQG